MKYTPIALLLAALAAPFAAQAASFDCAKAANRDEQAICANRTLNDLDVQMAASTNSCAACSPWARVARCRTASRPGWQNASGAAAIPPACCKATAPASPNWTTSTSASTNRCKESACSKPHVTVACVVHAAGKFLVVEETINGKALWNQPAGHLEADETLVQAAERELWEETGIRATPQAFLRLHQWIAPDRTPFLRFCFVIELEQPLPTEPHDSDIDRCLWLSADEILQAPNLRSALVAESIRSYQQPERYPLSLVGSFAWPF